MKFISRDGSTSHQLSAVSYQIEKVSELERVKVRVSRPEIRVEGGVLTPKKELLDISR